MCARPPIHGSLDAMDEPACKKLKVESDFESGDGLDGLSELEKLEPLPQTAHIGGDIPTTSQSSVSGPIAPTGYGQAGGAQTGGQPSQSSGQQQSVLQELLMTQTQGPAANNSPRPTFSAASTANNFNTRSPMTGATMMSPPNASMGVSGAGRGAGGPGPSPGGPPGAPSGGPMRTAGQGPVMYEGIQMSQQSQYGQPMMTGGPQGQIRGYPGQYPPQGAPNQIPYPGQGRGQAIPRGGIMNGAHMQRGPQMPPPGRPGMPPQMMQGMMRHPGMIEQPFNPNAPFQGQRPEQFMGGAPPQGFMNRQPYPGMMPGHPPGPPQGPTMIMMDPSQSNGPHQMANRAPVTSGPSQQTSGVMQMPNGAPPSSQQSHSHNLQSTPGSQPTQRTAGTPLTPGTQDPEKRKRPCCSRSGFSISSKEKRRFGPRSHSSTSAATAVSFDRWNVCHTRWTLIIVPAA